MREAKPSRRTVLKAGFGAGILLSARARAAQGPETILIVGAGLAGLSAAYRLREAGKRVTVIEAKPYAGGRVHTLRGNFGPGLYAETGAARIADNHEYVLHWVNELNLSLIPFAPANGDSILAIETKRARNSLRAEREQLIFGLKESEKGLSPAELTRRYVTRLPAELSDPNVNVANPRFAQYDAITWPNWLVKQGASAAAVKLMTLGGDSGSFSALYLLRQILLQRGATQYFKIQGGMDRLPLGIAARLKDVIRYRCELVRLEQDGPGVRAYVRENGGDATIAAQRAVVALPLPAMRSVVIDPPLSRAKNEAIQSLPYYAATRFLMQTKSRFWVGKGLNGGARTDAPADIWDTSFGEPGKGGLLTVTTGGDTMERRLSVMSDTARQEAGRAMARAAFSEIDAEHVKTVIQRWADDPFAGGAFAVFYPGQMTRWSGNLGTAEGRLHFAGEHTSPWTGWMEGALWSGERAAQEILSG